jgi:hypothetical protein
MPKRVVICLWNSALAAAAIALTATAFAAEELAPRPPEKPQFRVDIRPELYVPSGSVNVLDLKTKRYTEARASRQQLEIADTELPNVIAQVLSIVLKNVSGKTLDQVKVEYGLFKTDRQKQVKDIARGTEKLTVPAYQTTLLLANGSLESPSKRPTTVSTMTQPTGPPDEEFFGWYVIIYSNGQKIFEKYAPPHLKGSDLLKKNP